jgi:hypothetical protein
VTTLADGAFHAQLSQANLAPAVIAQIDSVWQNTLARAMSGNYTRLPLQATQWVTHQFAPAFTTGLAQTLLVMAGLVVGVAIFIYVGMERGRRGSLMTPPVSATSTSLPGRECGGGRAKDDKAGHFGCRK